MDKNLQQQQFSPGYRRYAVVLLMLTYAASVADRQIVAILLQPIKLEFGLSDSQLGLLVGLPFTLFLIVLGIPIAILADRGNRRNIVTWSLATFSLMTVLCGLSVQFWQLFLARMGVAIGEAGTLPPSQSIISDIYPPEQRAGALSLYSLGINVGILIGFLAGGWMAHLWGWRVALFTVGAPGLLLALIVRFTLKEPVRGQADDQSPTTTAPTLRQSIAWLRGQRSARHLAMAGFLNSAAATSTATWGPAYFTRSFALESAYTGTVLALVYGLLGALAAYAIGTCSDRLGRRDVRWYMWLPAINLLFMLPFAFGSFLISDAFLALFCFAVPAALFTAFNGPAFAMAHAVVPVNIRALTSAIFFFCTAGIGGGVGPQVVGLLSDLYAPRFGGESLRYALLTTMLAVPWAAIHLALATRTLQMDMARATTGSIGPRSNKARTAPDGAVAVE